MFHRILLEMNVIINWVSECIINIYFGFREGPAGYRCCEATATSLHHAGEREVAAEGARSRARGYV